MVLGRGRASGSPGVGGTGGTGRGLCRCFMLFCFISASCQRRGCLGHPGSLQNTDIEWRTRCFLPSIKLAHSGNNLQSGPVRSGGQRGWACTAVGARLTLLPGMRFLEPELPEPQFPRPLWPCRCDCERPSEQHKRHALDTPRGTACRAAVCEDKRTDPRSCWAPAGVPRPASGLTCF